MKKISILVPCYNEKESLPLLYTELAKLMKQNPQYEWEVLLVNDGSKDETLAVMKDLRSHDNRINYIDLSRNFGKERAMLAGFDYVTGDCMVIMDADLQHPPFVINDMLQKWEEGYDDVYAQRTTRGKEPWLRKQFSLLFYRILQKTTKIEILPNVGDFRLLDRKCIESLKQLRESERYTKGMFCWIGYKKIPIKFEQQDRAAGQTTWNFWGLLSLAVEGIVSFTTFPLKIATILGIMTSIIAFIYMIFVVIKAIVCGDPVAGFPTLLSVMLLLGGIQLLCIGVMGEYVSRIFHETKHRPVYFVREYNNEYIYTK